MYLKRLNIKGFKSFADRVELTFEQGVAVIVGPNGSGKSNVVDALLWAMSSVPPSGLRADTGQDVLFMGSGGRGRANRAEVELVLDNADGSLPVPYSEVSVQRTLDRDGESRYLINGSVVRRSDVVELLADAGLGKDMHSVIGQGRIDRLLAAKPLDRRAAIEEAAGLGKYKRRRKRARQKLDHVRLDVERVEDLERELKARLKPLRSQARAAQRFGTVLAERWTLQLALFKDGQRLAQQQAAQATTRRDTALTAMQKADAAAEAVRGERAAMDAAIGEAVRSSEAARDALQRITSVRDRLQIRSQSLDDRASALRREAAIVRANIERYSSERERWTRELASVEQRLSEVRTNIVDLTQRRATAVRQIADIEQLVSEERESSRELAAAEGRITAAAERRQAVARRIDRLDESITAGRTEHAQIQERREALAANLAELEREHEHAANELEKTHAQTQEAEQTLIAAEAAESEQRTEVAAAQQAVAMANERTATLQRRAEKLSDARDDRDQLPRLADQYNVDSGYERALAAALADDVDAFLVADAATLVDFVAAHTGTASRGIVQPIAQRAQRGGATTLPAAASGLVRALGDGSLALADVVHSRSSDGDVTARLMRAVVVEDLDAAVSELGRLPDGWAAADGALLVTTDGVGFEPASGRIWTVGPSATVDRFEVANELDDARGEAMAREKDHAALAATFQKAVDASIAARSALQTARAAEQQAERAIRDSEGRRAQVSRDVEGQQRTSDELTRTLATLASERDEQQKRLGELDALAANDAEQLAAAQAAHKTLAQRVADARSEENIARESVAAQSAELAGLDSEAKALERDERRLRGSIERGEHDSERDTARAARLDRFERLCIQAGVCASDVRESLADLDALRDRAEAGRRRMEEADRKRAELVERERVALAAQTATHGEVTTAEVAVAQAAERLEVAQNNVATAIDAYREHVVAAREELARARREAEDEGDLPPDPEDEGEGADVIELQELDVDGEVELDEAERERIASRIQRLDRSLSAIGPINPLAAREFAEQQERFDEIAKQRADLVATSRELEGLIRDLDQTLKARFDDTFVAVSHHFERSITALFPGGHGALRLVSMDPPGPAAAGESESGANADAGADIDSGSTSGPDVDDDVREDGVEIDVRPAGKPAGRLGLLSGGEKSLVALAFLFALFLARPSPFYVLDEVEAALDDANIVRFLALLETVRSSAQFLVITHQVRTMEAADVLYGVTMPDQAGISAVIARRPTRRGGTPPDKQQSAVEV